MFFIGLIVSKHNDNVSLMIRRRNFSMVLENFNVDDSIRELRKKFLEIRKMEYVKSVRGGTTGIGATFEALLGKCEDKLVNPDFKGIEVKTRRGYSKSLINLFNAAPQGSTDYEVKRLRDTYGYPDSYDKNLKRFNAKVSANEMIKIGIFYYFQLKVDRNRKRLILCVYDWNKVCIDDSIYWDFAVLKEKLFCKLNVLALVKGWPNKVGGVEYFKYYKMNVYVLRGFDSFLNALDMGIIKVSFKIGNYYDEARYGAVHSHGVGFAFAVEDLDKVFELSL